MPRAAIDMTGKVYGELTAVRALDPSDHGGGLMWLFRCSCGGERVVDGARVRSGRVRHCGGDAHDHGRTLTGPPAPKPPPAPRVSQAGLHLRDRVGERLGLLTITGFVGVGANGPIWRCRCDCTNVVDMLGSNLRGSRVRSCGCVGGFREPGDGIRRIHEHAAVTDLAGQRFGRLTVIGVPLAGSDGHGVSFLCRCDCGAETRVRATSLRTGTTLSCGCLAREKSRARMLAYHHRRRARPQCDAAPPHVDSRATPNQ